MVNNDPKNAVEHEQKCTKYFPWPLFSIVAMELIWFNIKSESIKSERVTKLGRMKFLSSIATPSSAIRLLEMKVTVQAAPQ